MPQPLTTTQIQQHIDAVNTGGVDAARQMYDSLYAQGYNYAGWASGVAKGNTITGQSALDYLSGTAMMGLGGDACRNLTPAQIDKIRVDMAGGYLKTLYDIADRSGGTVARDVNYKETESFHEFAFRVNGLGLDNWTLKTPMDLLRREKGEQAVEDVWQRVRNTGGDGFDSLMLSTGLLNAVGRNAFSPDPATQQQAQEWLDKVPGPTNWQQIKKFIDIFFKVSDDSIDWTTNYDQLGNYIGDLQNAFHTAKITMSPLILDLDGDGVETISKTAGIHFDHDGNGFAETTGWAGKDDGLLIWDRNGNGKIDNGGELFGNHTRLANGTKAANGFAALAELDVNRDGRIDSNDAAFAELRVWKDNDGNAVVSDGELLTLNDAGVQSLGTTYATQSQIDAQGNQHLQKGQYTRTDGISRTLTDVWFATDMARTVDQDLVEVNDTIAALPELQGFGNVHSLHQAMARDTSGTLQALVQRFADAADIHARQSLFQEILFTWTGSSQYAASSRGAYIDDGRKLYVLEAFLGVKFVQGSGTNAGTSNPGPNAAGILSAGYIELSNKLYGQLMAQTHLKKLYDAISLAWNTTTEAFELDVTALVDLLEAGYSTDPALGVTWMNEMGLALKAGGNFGEQVLIAARQHGNASGEGFAFHLAHLGYATSVGDSNDNTLSGESGRGNSLELIS
jgi:hypothetical protein